MNDVDQERWDRARVEVIERWYRVLDRIRARDEGEILSLTNEMDEFCDAAISSRTQSAAVGAGTVTGPGPDLDESRCHFCRGFLQFGGCSGLLQEINHVVLNGDWGKAQTLAEGYINRLEGLNFNTS
jgi:hypothetical protein